MKTTLYAQDEALVLDYTQSGDRYEFSLNGHSGQAQLISARNGSMTLLFNMDDDKVNDDDLQSDNDSIVHFDDRPSKKRSSSMLLDGRAVQAHVVSHGGRILVAVEGRVYEFSTAQGNQGRERKSQAGGWEPEIRSPMPGKILEVRVSQGDEVEANQTLVVLEAMKMENTLASGARARVKTIHVAPGELVELGQILVELEPLESQA